MPGRSHCELYVTGHKVAVPQWKNSANDPRTRTAAEVLTVDVEAMVITLVADGATFTCRTHAAARVEDGVERHGPRVIVDRRWSLLLWPEEDGAEGCVSADYSSRAWIPCRRASNRGTDPASLLERLVRDGGFLVPLAGVADAFDLTDAIRR